MTEKLKKSKGQGRTGQITIRIDPKILDGLTEIADKLGIAHSTLAGLAIGEYVVRAQASFINPAIMQESMGKELARQIANPLSHLFEGKSLEEIQAIADKLND